MQTRQRQAYVDALNRGTRTRTAPASKNTFIYGPRILKPYETETESQETGVPGNGEGYHDKRLIYFKRTMQRDDPRAQDDYMEMLAKAETEVIYGWLKEGLMRCRIPCIPWMLTYYMVASLSRYLADNSKKDEYITDYFNVVGYVDQAIANASGNNDEASAEYLGILKDGIVQGFVNSGAGDCKTLNEYYADKVEPNKDNKEFLAEVINALGSVGCSDSDLYFTASEYLYRLEPSANAALGLANRSLRIRITTRR